MKEFDPTRAARIDLKKRRQREDAKVAKRNVRSWKEELDNMEQDSHYNLVRHINQHR